MVVRRAGLGAVGSIPAGSATPYQTCSSSSDVARGVNRAGPPGLVARYPCASGRERSGFDSRGRRGAALECGCRLSKSRARRVCPKRFVPPASHARNAGANPAGRSAARSPDPRPGNLRTGGCGRGNIVPGDGAVTGRLYAWTKARSAGPTAGRCRCEACRVRYGEQTEKDHQEAVSRCL